MPASFRTERRCFLVFRGRACDYRGGEDWCDRSLHRCRELGNSRRFSAQVVEAPVPPEHRHEWRPLAVWVHGTDEMGAPMVARFVCRWCGAKAQDPGATWLYDLQNACPTRRHGIELAP